MDNSLLNRLAKLLMPDLRGMTQVNEAEADEFQSQIESEPENQAEGVAPHAAPEDEASTGSGFRSTQSRFFGSVPRNGGGGR